ncbi:uncharacterized protein KY384_007809 [Bacidia gigantensis]|uniref:uncharacterized protein n=1 Tax=Bacidia gigantensis TaxID=2732470 RepID=UPI001D046A52|nr:uncharacterized protein KY384_007809 [Bacidia gigantensis]KAG8527656.1 hypothetical protein KY384_007809 [Bacidia gigantensis]
MSGMEFVAVLACVAGVVTAFEQGEKLVKKIREKRRLNHQAALRPAELENSLAIGSSATEQAKRDCTTHLGKAFERGDGVASTALIHIRNELYESIVKHLLTADEDDNSEHDFSAMIEVSDFGRIRSVMVLNELLMRIAQQAPVQSIQTWTDSDRDYYRSLSSVESRATNSLSANRRVSSNSSPRSPSNPSSPTFKIGLRQKLSNWSRNASYIQADHRRQQDSFGDSADTHFDRQSTPVSTLKGSPQSTFVNGSLESNSLSTMATANPWHNEPTSPRSRQSAHEGAGNRTEKRLPKTKRWSLSASTTGKQDYGGFCKGACIMRTGNGGMNLCNQSVAMTGQGHYWACSKCAFEGGAIKSSKGWSFDESVREAYGVRYRWKFLAKSHVAPTERVNNRIYDYQCVLCSAQGMEPVVKRGEKAFMEHVSGHRGDKHNRYGMQLIVAEFGRVALEEQKSWDVNLLPLVIEEVDGDISRMKSSSPGSGINMNAKNYGNYHTRLATLGSEPLLQSPEDARINECYEGRKRDDEVYSPINDESMPVHPALRAQFSVPDPWRDSYVTVQGDL